MRDIFLEPKRDEAFASISEDLINNDNIRYIFPKGRFNYTCYKINRQILKDLIQDGILRYNSENEICEKEYSQFFEKRSLMYTKTLLEYCGDTVHF